jgi:hypothetical protein
MQLLTQRKKCNVLVKENMNWKCWNIDVQLSELPTGIRQSSKMTGFCDVYITQLTPSFGGKAF